MMTTMRTMMMMMVMMRRTIVIMIMMRERRKVRTMTRMTNITRRRLTLRGPATNARLSESRKLNHLRHMSRREEASCA